MQHAATAEGDGKPNLPSLNTEFIAFNNDTTNHTKVNAKHLLSTILPLVLVATAAVVHRSAFKSASITVRVDTRGEVLDMICKVDI